MVKSLLFKFMDVILLLSLNILNFIFLIFLWGYLNLGDLKGESTYQLFDLIIFYPIIQQYILLLFFLCSIISISKKLNSIKQGGLISIWLRLGLFCGILCLLIGFSFGLVIGLIPGLIIGLICGLVDGLLISLVLGIMNEFWID